MCGERENVRIEAVNGHDDGGCATIPNDTHLEGAREAGENQILKTELERIIRVKAWVDLLLIGAPGTRTSQLEEWLKQIPGYLESEKDTTVNPQSRDPVEVERKDH